MANFTTLGPDINQSRLVSLPIVAISLLSDTPSVNNDAHPDKSEFSNR